MTEGQKKKGRMCVCSFSKLCVDHLINFRDTGKRNHVWKDDKHAWLKHFPFRGFSHLILHHRIDVMTTMEKTIQIHQKYV